MRGDLAFEAEGAFLQTTQQDFSRLDVVGLCRFEVRFLRFSVFHSTALNSCLKCVVSTVVAPGCQRLTATTTLNSEVMSFGLAERRPTSTWQRDGKAIGAAGKCNTCSLKPVAERGMYRSICQLAFRQLLSFQRESADKPSSSPMRGKHVCCPLRFLIPNQRAPVCTIGSVDEMWRSMIRTSPWTSQNPWSYMLLQGTYQAHTAPKLTACLRVIRLLMSVLLCSRCACLSLERLQSFAIVTG